MKMIEEFQQHWQKHFEAVAPKHQQLFIVAVSGGVDSMCLLHLTKQCNFNIVAAHCNFQLRGDEADAETALVKAYCDKHAIPLEIATFDTANYASQQKLSIQVAARNLRYQFFKSLQEKYTTPRKKVWVLTAHHANDNMETMLMHFFRGSGIVGVTGIPEIDATQKIIRPLLRFERNNIETFAQAEGLAFAVDSSNLKNDYTRNFFRNELIPSIQKVFPQVEHNLQQNIFRFELVKQVYHQFLAKKKQQLLIPSGNGFVLHILALKKINGWQGLIWDLLQPFGITAAQVPEVVKLFDAENSAFLKTSSHLIYKNRNQLIIIPPSKQYEEAAQIILENQSVVNFQLGQIHISKIPAPTQLLSDTHFAFLDANDIQFPLLLRKWKQGDYFYPFGLNKKKKISKFLIDLKLSPIEKNNTWVLEDASNKIIWIVGKRIHHRVAVKPSTQNILRIMFEPKISGSLTVE